MIPRQPTEEEKARDRQLRDEMYKIIEKYGLQMVLWVGTISSSAVSKCTPESLHYDIIPMALTVLADASVKMNMEMEAAVKAAENAPGAGG